MALTLTAGPAAEPILLTEAKAHLRIDGTTEDVYIGSLILTSRLQIEEALGLALVSQSWRLTIEQWPKARHLLLPMRPVSSITAIHAIAADGDMVALPTVHVRIDTGNPARLVRAGEVWPEPATPYQSIAIDFVAGFGPSAADVPQPIRHALLLLVAHWYEHRDPYGSSSPGAGIPCAVSDLLMPFREARL